ncbi:MAG: outer membrane protein transport protein, partial [Pseudomonadota bacterium]
GASTDYPDGTSLDPTNAANVYGGSVASLDNYRLSTILAYDVTDGVKVYGGPVFSVIEANAAISFLSYDVDSDLDYGIGYLVGAAYEKPDIALRVALTYRSEIRHEFDTVETIGATSVNSQTTIDLPQSLTLDFQTGIAPKTLLFGQVQWMDWSSFEISPPNYPLLASLGRPLVSYEEDWFTYTLGVGRQINDNWSGAFSVTWEPQTNTELTSLGPVDGRWQLGLGATYETEKVKISGGASYAFLGDAENVLATDYSGGDALGFGLRVGFKL